MLDRSAALAAELCRRYEIPVAWLYAADLKAGRRGLTTHKAVSEAFRRSNHWDPGNGFPVESYLARVRAELGAAPVQPPPPLKPPPQTLRRGDGGWLVKRLQRLLRSHGCFPEPALLDGDFGPITEAAVEAFQELNDLEPDGVVGPLTWHALLTLEPAVPAAEALASGERLEPV
jgi:hypothetical protein